MHKILIYLRIIHLLKSSICFERYPAHLQKVYVVTVYMQPLVSSLSAGDCPVHRLRKNSSTLYQHVLVSDLGFQTRSAKDSNDWELLNPLTQIRKRNQFPKPSVPKNGDDIQNIRQIIAIYHQYISDFVNPLNPELNAICYLLALLGAHHFLHVSSIRVKLLTFRLLMSYIYIWSTHSWCF